MISALEAIKVINQKTKKDSSKRVSRLYATGYGGIEMVPCGICHIIPNRRPAPVDKSSVKFCMSHFTRISSFLETAT